jgi:squalene-hopene/tetraprenyl-beta-curcumene cyclase
MNGCDLRVATDGERTARLLTARLLAEATPAGTWEGELSASALATAVAITALVIVDRDDHAEAVARGARWLCESSARDGGWGDSPESCSNLSTTTLVWSALALAEGDKALAARCAAGKWISQRAGTTEAVGLAAALVKRYGNDRTFSAPIVAVAALTGQLGESPRCWSLVPQLPFELAVLPARLFSWLRLPVVSYALPALIAIGLVRHRRLPSRWAPLRWVRDALTQRVLAQLARLQPRHGGFLEATPLTAFVTMSLAACGLRDGAIVERGVAFLRSSQRADGSWPIDTNLATWLTTWAVKAFAADGPVLSEGHRKRLVQWLLAQQTKTRHPYTQAAPGGFAWTDLAGGVPDADDTAGALLALRSLDAANPAVRRAAERASEWLIALQNRDGGVPTFCRGWGRMPFDKSCPDVTAHAVRALCGWAPMLPGSTARRSTRFVGRALRYLVSAQRRDGAWLPLWFGSQWQPGGENGVYGTAQVVLALVEIDALDTELSASLERGSAWLVRAQNADGGWGRDAQGESTVEETGLALAALAGRVDEETLARGVRWLDRRLQAGKMAPAPIGLYFSSLWYSERLYPVLFALFGLGRVLSTRKTAYSQMAAACEGKVA